MPNESKKAKTKLEKPKPKRVDKLIKHAKADLSKVTKETHPKTRGPGREPKTRKENPSAGIGMTLSSNPSSMPPPRAPTAQRTTAQKAVKVAPGIQHGMNQRVVTPVNVLESTPVRSSQKRSGTTPSNSSTTGTGGFDVRRVPPEEWMAAVQAGPQAIQDLVIKYRPIMASQPASAAMPGSVSAVAQAASPSRHTSSNRVGIKEEDYALHPSIAGITNPEKVLSPNCNSYLKALHDPDFDPDGCDIRPPGYGHSDVPTQSAVITCSGQHSIVPDADVARVDILYCVGPGNPQRGDYDPGPASAFAPYAVQTFTDVAQYCVLDNGGGGFTWHWHKAVTPGAPPDGRAVESGTENTPLGLGVAGFAFYWLKGLASGTAYDTEGLRCDVDGTFDDTGSDAHRGYIEILYWGTPAPFGDMKPANADQYRFRAICGNLQITNATQHLSMGGTINLGLVAESRNDPFAEKAQPTSSGTLAVYTGNPYGKATSLAAFTSMPDHSIQSAADSVSINWKPGRLDNDFMRTGNVTTNSAGQVSYVERSGNPIALVSTDDCTSVTTCRGARMAAVIFFPPMIGNGDFSYQGIQTLVVTYSAKFEIAGWCTQNVGTITHPDPMSGAAIRSAIDYDMRQPLKSLAHLGRQAAFNRIKEMPGTDAIAGAQDPEEASSILDGIMRVGKSILPEILAVL